MQLGEVGTRVLFENEKLKVWLLVLEPGEASSWHQHDYNYFYIVIEPGKARTELIDGSYEPEQEDFLGKSVMRRKDQVHRLVNVGTTRYMNLVVELKDQLE